MRCVLRRQVLVVFALQHQQCVGSALQRWDPDLRQHTRCAGDELERVRRRRSWLALAGIRCINLLFTSISIPAPVDLKISRAHALENSSGTTHWTLWRPLFVPDFWHL